MNSPFPGMDPYLERHWGDVHARLIVLASESLQQGLPKELRARCEERVFVQAEAYRRTIGPDVRIVERPRPASAFGGGAATAVLEEPATAAEPYLVRDMISEPIRERFIEIRESGGGRIVTVIEFLSPANKRPGAGRDLYLRKQAELLEGDVNGVEIDLLRAGAHTTSVPEPLLPDPACKPYHACVRRAALPGQYEVYALPLRSRLPAIRIPLRPTDSDATLDLQAVLDRGYAGGGYDDLDYAAPLDPPLPDEDEAWADALLRAAGRRGHETGRKSE